MPFKSLTLRLVLAVALVANAWPTAAGMAMAIGLAPCAHGPVAPAHDDATATGGQGHHCDDPAEPNKAPAAPCCADGKCQCAWVAAPAVTVALLINIPHSAPDLASSGLPVALAPPAPAELLRPPIG